MRDQFNGDLFLGHHRPGINCNLAILLIVLLTALAADEVHGVAVPAHDAGCRETSLATIQSQPLRASFDLALSMRCSVSAAKPITSGGRLSVSLEIVARISGFSTSWSGGMPAEVFFSFCSPSLATRQSATAAAKIAMSAGSAACTCSSICRADSTCLTVTPWGSLRSTGPLTRITSAPAASAAAAIAKPCLPEDRLAM